MRFGPPDPARPEPARSLSVPPARPGAWRLTLAALGVPAVIVGGTAIASHPPLFWAGVIVAVGAWLFGCGLLMAWERFGLMVVVLVGGLGLAMFAGPAFRVYVSDTRGVRTEAVVAAKVPRQAKEVRWECALRRPDGTPVKFQMGEDDCGQTRQGQRITIVEDPAGWTPPRLDENESYLYPTTGILFGLVTAAIVVAGRRARRAAVRGSSEPLPAPGQNSRA
ncbi:hypothetical protein ACRYCC_13535 [Actinomadura scrupuli]|uniref:hypothetical protein n=1 Tax=Actinomadura scrupuli TaxID=559629 RepID=UPI003D991611